MTLLTPNNHPRPVLPETSAEWLDIIVQLSMQVKLLLPNDLWNQVDLLTAACEYYTLAQLKEDIIANCKEPVARRTIALIEHLVNQRLNQQENGDAEVSV